MINALLKGTYTVKYSNVKGTLVSVDNIFPVFGMFGINV